MNNRSIYIFIIIIFISCLPVTSFMSCRHEPVLLAELDTVCFKEQVLPVLQTSCAISGCHDNGTASEEFVATSYESIIKAVNPGDARSSLLYEVITDINAEHFMPPDRPLSQQQRTLIHIWIAQGALNNSCIESSCDTSGTIAFSTQVRPVINNNCTGCHNSSFSNGGVNLDGYAQVKTYAEAMINGTPVIVGVINYMPGFANMPPQGKLDDCSIRKIELWIDQGVADN
jgi:cytochrome c5